MLFRSHVRGSGQPLAVPDQVRSLRALAASTIAAFISSTLTGSCFRRTNPLSSFEWPVWIERTNRPLPVSVNSMTSPGFKPSERRTALGIVIRPFELSKAVGMCLSQCNYWHARRDQYPRRLGSDLIQSTSFNRCASAEDSTRRLSFKRPASSALYR